MLYLFLCSLGLGETTFVVEDNGEAEPVEDEQAPEEVAEAEEEEQEQEEAENAEAEAEEDEPAEEETEAKSEGEEEEGEEGVEGSEGEGKEEEEEEEDEENGEEEEESEGEDEGEEELNEEELKKKQIAEALARRRKSAGTVPYLLEQTILLVGEGNFSFASALATTLRAGTAASGDSSLTVLIECLHCSLLLPWLGGWVHGHVGVAAGTNIVATSLDTFDECKEKYNDVVEHIRAFEKVGGTVLHKVYLPTTRSSSETRAKLLWAS
jgi:hypothetical protein